MAERRTGQRQQGIPRAVREGDRVRFVPPEKVKLEGVFDEIIPQLQRALIQEKYRTPTPIQEQAIRPILEARDILGCAQTGTGKTAAFILPILQVLNQNRREVRSGEPRVLVVTPTRELAAQIGDSITAYGRFLRAKHGVIFGGVGQQPQVNALNRGLDIVVATPGRLLDLMNQGFISLQKVEIFVLDEADRMLDMGFIPDIRRIMRDLPRERQSLFFSATMPKPVVALARDLVFDPVHISVSPEKIIVERIVQRVYFLDRRDKDALLADLLENEEMSKVLVFTKMKHVANRVAQKLDKRGYFACAIHGNKSQTARTSALDHFKCGRARVLVATDIAARGIDVDGITHVVNYDLPHEAETYVHRIGRTARAELDGDAISFCAADERDDLRAIEKLIKMQIMPLTDHPYHSEKAMNAKGADAKPAPKPVRPPRRRTGPPRGRR